MKPVAEKLDLNYEPTKADRERFWNKVAQDSAIECWPWRGGRFAKGYGAFYWPGFKPGYAHRFAWLIHHGSVPADKVVMHTCDNRACVNPGHLRLGSFADNTQDSVSKGRWMTPARVAGLERSLAARMVALQKKPPSLPIGKKYGEIGIPEPGDGYDMGIFVILERPGTSPITPGGDDG